MFVIGKIVGAFLVPPGIFITLTAIAFAFVLSGRRKLAIGFLSTSLVIALLLSMGPVADLLIAPLEHRYPPLTETVNQDQLEADAVAEKVGGPELARLPVVVLGGGFLRSTPGSEAYGRLRPESMERAYYGARLAERGNASLIFTGGSIIRDRHGGTEADAASRLWREMGIEESRIRLERNSLDTYGNAQFVKRIVGSGPVILVTSAWHMPRAMLAFRRAWIEAIAASCAYRSESGGHDFTDWLPGSMALQTSALALHEYIGLVWYSIVPHHPAPGSGGKKARG